MTTEAPADLHRLAVEAVVTRTLSGTERVVSVDSPPGAGKSELVIETADRGSESPSSDQLGVISQTNEQADDLTVRLARRFAEDGRLVGRLHGREYIPPARLAHRAIRAAPQLAALSDCSVVIAPAAKWAYIQGEWQIGIIDETYQMRSDALLRIGDRFGRLLSVGDPGQLDPFTTGDETLVRGLPFSPIETAAQALHATHPHAVVTLPVSWRLTPAAVSLISPSFYLRPFTAGTGVGDRGLELGPARGHRADPSWEMAAARGWSYVELPPAHLRRTDPELVEVLADLVEGLLTRGGATHDGAVSRIVSAASIAVGVVHRDQRAAVSAAVDRRLSRLGIAAGSVVVDTANRLQGREFEVVVCWHPLSGRRDASAFHLEAGRLCVLLSRHRQACVVVSRAGARDVLESYPATDPIWVGEPFPAVDGWEANLAVLERLEEYRVVAA